MPRGPGASLRSRPGLLETARTQAASALNRTRRAALAEVAVRVRALDDARENLVLAGEARRRSLEALARAGARLRAGTVTALDRSRAELGALSSLADLQTAQEAVDLAALDLYAALALPLEVKP